MRAQTAEDLVGQIFGGWHGVLKLFDFDIQVPVIEGLKDLPCDQAIEHGGIDGTP